MWYTNIILWKKIIQNTSFLIVLLTLLEVNKICFALAGPTTTTTSIPTEEIPVIEPEINHSFEPCDRTRRIFTSSYGEFSDGPTGFNYTQVIIFLNYTNFLLFIIYCIYLFFLLKDSHCEWLIKAKNSSQFITLQFHSMGTECSYDYIFVYDGDSFQSPLLGSFSGKTEPQRIVATSGNVYIIYITYFSISFF